MEERNNGSQLEGKTTEIGGLMMQDTNGAVDFLKKTITNEPDGGIDYELSIPEDFDYVAYNEQLKGGK